MGDTAINKHLLQGTWPGIQVGKALYRQGTATSQSQALVLTREDFNHAGICRRTTHLGISIQSAPGEH